jgi:hypothetical protein
LFLLVSLPFGAWSALLPFVIVFLSMDVILATLACIIERESILVAWRILPMRLIYRPMLSYVVWKAILRAVKGALVGWGKLERTASVPVRGEAGLDTIPQTGHPHPDPLPKGEVVPSP